LNVFPLGLACVASFCLGADYSATCGAAPFFPFAFQEIFHAFFFYVTEGIDYAYSIFSGVVFVDFF
jgi:hypothetical protein